MAMGRAGALFGLTALIGCASAPPPKPPPSTASPPKAQMAPAEAHLVLTTVPADAQVFIDNEPVADGERSSIPRKPGPHVLSVTRPGYMRSDYDIVLTVERPLQMTVKLEGSPDTGFELISEPPGMLVWLDGAPIQGQDGGTVRTNFRASRILPGRHVLELRSGDARFLPWREELEIEPGVISRVQAVMKRAGN